MVDIHASRLMNGIVNRNEGGRKKKAATSTLLDGSCFYRLFPGRSNKNQLPDKLGYFEDLNLYCGLF